MKLTGRFLGPPQIALPTPASRLAELIGKQARAVADALQIQFSRRGIRIAVLVLGCGLAAQAVWLYVVPFAWGWDSTANLAIGRMYFGLPYRMWSIKDYYPPGYPIFLTLAGVHHLDTLGPLRIATRSEEHTSELQSRGLISYAVFCL